MANAKALWPSLRWVASAGDLQCCASVPRDSRVGCTGVHECQGSGERASVVQEVFELPGVARRMVDEQHAGLSQVGSEDRVHHLARRGTDVGKVVALPAHPYVEGAAPHVLQMTGVLVGMPLGQFADQRVGESWTTRLLMSLRGLEPGRTDAGIAVNHRMTSG